MTETVIGWIIVFCIFPGIITLSILDKKGERPIKGFLFGFLLSYLGVAIAWILPVNYQKLKQKNQKIIDRRQKTIGLIQGKMKSCPYCQEIVDMDAMNCKYCRNYI